MILPIVARQFNVAKFTMDSGNLVLMENEQSRMGCAITVIQVYAPIADSDEEEHDDFYEQLEKLICRQRSYVVVMVDFNARIGSRRSGEVYVGPLPAEERNEAGQRLANFCELHHLYHGNSQFLKPSRRRWTHITPNAQHCHELDHILCNRRIMTDVAVVPSFNTGSDHRLLRG
ncbi:hypothetical protein TELCIR_00811 [Teladorsagia circumcincta]|uniref:Endonuclease/exonuclease/phosphatase domain-containing protein n=1 Tax=Teladorsagia circumcincta TaxID=45464 RepID=A0A2G9V3M6_TELCI|nr:hypothetical protein TELCIR_00811 [Teladorsagia circumcincta]